MPTLDPRPTSLPELIAHARTWSRERRTRLARLHAVAEAGVEEDWILRDEYQEDRAFEAWALLDQLLAALPDDETLPLCVRCGGPADGPIDGDGAPWYRFTLAEALEGDPWRPDCAGPEAHR